MVIQGGFLRRTGAFAAIGATVLLTSGGAAHPAAPRAHPGYNEDASPSGAAFVPTRQGGIPGALLPDELHLWKYDTSTGKYTVVDGDATQPYVVNTDRQFPAGTSIGYEEGWASNPFSVSIHDSLFKLAPQMGATLPQCDVNYDPNLAVSCADTLSLQHPAFVINSNWKSEAAAATAQVYDAAKIPAVSVDVVHPNEIFMGADNYVSGELAGKGAGEYAKAAGHCGDAWMVVGGSPPDGEAANLRITGFEDGVQEVCGAFPADRIVDIVTPAGTTDEALTKMTDWLTAHPTVPYVLATSIDDERVTGLTKAIAQSGRQGVGVGHGCDQVGIDATKQSTVEETHFLGCVAYYPEKYPDYLMSVAYDVLAGTPVPQEIHIAHQLLTRENIAQYYP